MLVDGVNFRQYFCLFLFVQLVLSKPQRKDKGKSRFTAYMLWAKDVRCQMLSIHPDLDFATISRKLGEMWANVPSNEKYNWRRRAKRLSSKGKDKVIGKSLSQAAVPSTKFINRNTPPSTKTKPKRTPMKNVSVASPDLSNDVKSPKLSPTSSSLTYKSKPGQQPADVAAHLQLLGESLTIIGERLKEHEVTLFLCYQQIERALTPCRYSRVKSPFRGVYPYFWTVYCARYRH